MFECQEDFRLADEDREDAVKTSTDRVRMAADEDELEASFMRVMGLLDQVRRRQREKRRRRLLASSHHQVKRQSERVRQMAIAKFPQPSFLPHSMGRIASISLGAS